MARPADTPTAANANAAAADIDVNLPLTLSLTRRTRARTKSCPPIHHYRLHRVIISDNVDMSSANIAAAAAAAFFILALRGDVRSGDSHNVDGSGGTSRGCQYSGDETSSNSDAAATTAPGSRRSSSPSADGCDRVLAVLAAALVRARDTAVEALAVPLQASRLAASAPGVVDQQGARGSRASFGSLLDLATRAVSSASAFTLARIMGVIMGRCGGGGRGKEKGEVFFLISSLSDMPNIKLNNFKRV